jgi:hypothetical protein
VVIAPPGQRPDNVGIVEPSQADPAPTPGGPNPMEPSFVHLRVHSEYSLADGLVRVKPLVAAAAARGMPAVVCSPISPISSPWCASTMPPAAGIKPIVGVDA